MKNKINRERYARQLLLPDWGEVAQEKVAAARVVIIGAGGLGSPVAIYLACAGIGKIGIVDNDIVAMHNLNRQILYQEGDIGKRKAEVAKERLQELNPDTQVIAYPCRLSQENAEAIIGDYDIVVDGSDNFATRYLINDVSLRLKRPFVYGAISQKCGQVAVFNYGKPSANYRTLFPDEAKLTTLEEKTLPVVGVVPGTIALLQANEVLKIITQTGTVMKDLLFSIDLDTLECSRVALPVKY